MHTTFTASVLLLAAALIPCSCRTAQDDAEAKAAAMTHQVQPSHLGAMHMTLADGDVYLGGQPSRADLTAGARYPGIRTVLSLRRDAESKGFDESATLSDLGVTYQNVPFGSPDQLTDQVFSESLNVIKDAPRPLVVHCASGNRVGAIWMAHRMLNNGYTEAAALSEARQVGLRNDEFIPVVLDYVQRRRAESQGNRESPSR